MKNFSETAAGALVKSASSIRFSPGTGKVNSTSVANLKQFTTKAKAKARVKKFKKS